MSERIIPRVVKEEQLDLFTKETTIKLPECPIATEVMKQVGARATVGKEKYGKTMAREDLTTVQWIDHAIEEALDFACYLTRLKKDYSSSGSSNNLAL